MARRRREIEGFVVAGRKKACYLSRTFQFVRHRDRKKRPGICNAWVHTKEALDAGGRWTKHVHTVYPARYDPKLRTTVITGPGMRHHHPTH